MQGSNDVLDFDNLTFGQARDLENCMVQMREEYNQLIAGISHKQTVGSLWWITSVSSRSLFQSPLFTRCAQLYLLSGYLSQGVEIRHIKCRDRAMATVIKEYRRRNKAVFIVSCPKKSAWRQIRHALSYVYYPIKTLFSYLWLHYSLFRKHKTDLPEHKEITLIEVFALDSTINKTGYTERYFNGLLDYLNEDEKKSVYMFPCLLFSKNSLRDKYITMMNLKCPKFLPCEQFLRVKDYFSAFLFAFRCLTQRYTAAMYKGFDISKLLKDEAGYAFRDDTISNFLRYKSIERLNGAGINVRHLLDWYEGQPTDRATLYAFNKFFPGTATIAFLGGHVGNLSLQQHAIPARHEQAAGMTAKVLAVMGKNTAETAGSINCSLDIMVAPALRYNDSWRDNITIGKRVVVALSYFADVNLIIINSLLEAVNECEALQTREIVIKKHPADRNKYDFSMHRNITQSNEVFSDLLKDCAVLITGTGTSTGMETIAKGIPVIAMGKPYDVNVNFIPDSITREIWELCYATENLKKSLKKFLNLTDIEKQKLKETGNNIREQYFDPTTREKARELLRL